MEQQPVQEQPQQHLPDAIAAVAREMDAEPAKIEAEQAQANVTAVAPITRDLREALTTYQQEMEEAQVWTCALFSQRRAAERTAASEAQSRLAFQSDVLSRLLLPAMLAGGNGAPDEAGGAVAALAAGLGCSEEQRRAEAGLPAGGCAVLGKRKEWEGEGMEASGGGATNTSGGSSGCGSQPGSGACMDDLGADEGCATAAAGADPQVASAEWRSREHWASVQRLGALLDMVREADESREHPRAGTVASGPNHGVDVNPADLEAAMAASTTNEAASGTDAGLMAACWVAMERYAPLLAQTDQQRADATSRDDEKEEEEKEAEEDKEEEEEEEGAGAEAEGLQDSSPVEGGAGSRQGTSPSLDLQAHLNRVAAGLITRHCTVPPSDPLVIAYGSAKRAAIQL